MGRGKRRKIKNKKRFYNAMAIVSILLTSGFAFGAYMYVQFKNPQMLFSPAGEGDIKIGEQFDENIINLMFVGFDKDEERSETSDIFRTDTNIVMSINLKEKTVDMISIPRDSYVNIARSESMDKFNAAYGHGYIHGTSGEKEKDGFDYLMATASDLLGGIPISHYAAVDMDVVQEIVDAIGGVEIEVPTDLYAYKDWSKVVIHKGHQKLDGQDLLYYARYRQYPRGDIGRAENQQRIMMAIFDSLKKSNMLTSLPKIYQSVQKNIKTNLNLNQIAALALFAKDLDKANIATHMMPGDFGELNGLSYWMIDQDKRVELIQEIYGITARVERQEPAEETLVSIKASVTQNILNVGESANITVKGRTSLGNNKLFDPGDVIYTSSNNKILTVTSGGLVTATGVGNGTVMVKVGEVVEKVNITVKQPQAITAPVLSLKGQATMTIKAGEKFMDPGATATDNLDKDLTSRITKNGVVDSQRPGTYKITYRVVDKAGNIAEKTRTVIVRAGEIQPQPPKENMGPTIKLKGDPTIILKQGELFTDPGAIATDPEDDDLTNKIQVLGIVDPNTVGTYTLTYTVKDQGGKKATVERKVIIEPKQNEVESHEQILEES